MSNPKTILQALTKFGIASYDELEAETKMKRNPLRWTCNALKQNGHAKLVEDSSRNEQVWKITPTGRAHLAKISAEAIQPAAPHKTGSMANPKKATKAKTNNLSETPGAGGEITAPAETKSCPSGDLDPPSPGSAVVEQPAADDSLRPAGSDVNTDTRWLPKLNLTINQIGCVEIAYGKDRFAIPANDVRVLVDFLDSVETLWSKSA